MLHLAGWIVAQYIYVPLGISGDQDNFLYTFSANFLSSNGLTSLFYRLAGVILPGYFPTLLITILSAHIIYKSTLFFYPFINKFLFWSANSLPHFLIWSGIASKEAIYIPLAIYVCACSAHIITAPKKKYSFSEAILLLIAFAFMAVIRPHFTIVYAFLFFGSLFWSHLKGSLSRLLSFNKYSKSFVAVLSLILAFSIPLCSWLILQSQPDLTSSLMSTSRSYFLSEEANTNRDYIVWETANDFLSNMSWGLPQSIIGFTFSEAVMKFQYLPAFIEGLFSLYLVFRCSYSPFCRLQPSQKLLYILIFIPSLISIILILYPFAIFNPGSATRYKQSISPLLYFYPLFLSSAIAIQKRKSHVS